MRSSRLLPCWLFVLIAVVSSVAAPSAENWGFFGHRRINRLATFTLPLEMMPAFRRNIDYLSEHAVDPDKRRYAAAGEAVRHFIDLDRYGELPRDLATARWQHGRVLDVTDGGDTIVWHTDTLLSRENVLLLRSAAQTLDLPGEAFRRLWYRNEVDPTDSLLAWGLPLAGNRFELVTDFGEHGILPYHLEAHHRQLTRAFVDRDADRILQLAAEIGHYVGDAHVPLHTTENYNGQLTGQDGIHAFWESRLPELFADAEYDYFVGPATYIEDPRAYYWQIVLDSHALVDSVLHTERRLRETFPADRQFCYEERLGREVRTQCTAFARAWAEAMDGMVEDRFRAAIQSVGSAWYSCWVDAGQPDLAGLFADPGPVERDTLPPAGGNHPARPHE